jgi:hypothetical protein
VQVPHVALQSTCVLAAARFKTEKCLFLLM